MTFKIKWSERDRCYRIWERNERYVCLEYMQFATEEAAQANIDLRSKVDEAVSA